MNRRAHHAQIGQWYLRRDLGEIFQVTGYDDHSRTIEIQTSDGDLDEIEGELWRQMSLELIEPPEHWSGPVDDIEDGEDPGDTNSGTDGFAPLELFATAEEGWEDSTAEEEIDSYTERVDLRTLH
jgi:uncharacterized protein DUF6763